MAKTAIILGETAAVVVTVTDAAFSASTRTVVQTAAAQHRVQPVSIRARSRLEASRFKDAGFTEKEIDEIGFVLSGILKVRHDA